MITDINRQFSADLAKKILANKENVCRYLFELNRIEPIVGLGDVRGVKNLSTNDLYSIVVSTWNYQRAKPIIRELFKETAKYRRGKQANEAVFCLRQEWQKLQLGDLQWPFSQGDFDNFVQRVNSSEQSGDLKDDQVKLAAVRFRRLKEINTYRNDYIETLIFEQSDTILPTLSHRRGVDFFIDGISFDQKVSRSVTSEFKAAYGDRWKEQAIEHPMEVARYLYTYQDEGRFDANPRLLIVYLDEDLSVETIVDAIERTDFHHPQTVTFDYKHKNEGVKSYATPCIVILLHN